MERPRTTHRPIIAAGLLVVVASMVLLFTVPQA